jgi:hypothetical protein
VPSRTYTFRIGDAFPATDPVARFVAVLATIYEDWRRTLDSMTVSMEGDADADDGVGNLVLRFRQIVGYSHEATEFLTKARRDEAKIDGFVSGLHTTALEAYDDVFTELKPIEEWMMRQRHRAFHYPEVIQAKYEHDQDEWGKALDAANEADDQGSATIGPLRETRLDFADVVVVHLLGFDLVEDPEQKREFEKLVVALREANVALGLFAAAAVGTYLESLPPGTVERAEND